MPIAQLNKDGTVKIYNANTGETKDVSPADLPKYNPKLVGEYFKLTNAKPENTNDPVKELASVKAQKELADITSGKSTTKTVDETQGDRDKEKKARTALAALTRIQKAIEGDPNIVTKAALPGTMGARSYSSDYSSVVDLLGNLRTGATVTPEQQKLYEDLLPRVGDSPEDIKNKFDARKSEFGAYIPEGSSSGELSENQFPPESLVGTSKDGLAMQTAKSRSPAPEQKGALGMLTDFLFGNTKKLPGRLMDLSNEQAQRAPAKGLGEATGRAFNDTMSLLGATVPAGVEVGSIMPAGKGLLAGGKAAAKVPGSIAGKVSLSKIGANRDAAVAAGKGIKFSGDELLKAGEQYVENDPMARNVFNKILPTLKGKEIDLPTLMKKIDVWNDAYTAAGRVGKSAEAGINDIFARGAKKMIAKDAPDVMKANKAFSRAYGFRNTAKKVVPAAAAGVGFSFGGDLLSSLLFGDNK